MILAKHNQLRLEIVEDNPDVGFYLYVYDGEQCIADYLQHDEDTCKQVALKEYGVELNLWREKTDE